MPQRPALKPDTCEKCGQTATTATLLNHIYIIRAGEAMLKCPLYGWFSLDYREED